MRNIKKTFRASAFITIALFAGFSIPEFNVANASISGMADLLWAAFGMFLAFALVGVMVKKFVR